MGVEKATLELDGVSLLERTLRLVAPLVSEVLVVGAVESAEVRSAPVEHRVVPDGAGPRCALRGVVAALEATDRELVWLLSVDLPRLRPELLLAQLAYLVGDAVVPRLDGIAHPLCALVRREPALAAARAKLAAGVLALQGWIAELETCWLEGGDLEAIDPAGRSLTNVNTPEEWERVKRADDRSGAP